MQRLPKDPAEYEKINCFVLLFPREGESVSLESQCYRILGTVKDAQLRANGKKMEFWLNATPSIHKKSDRLAYKVVLEEVPGINDGLQRGGDVVARILEDPTGTENCKGKYYDFYYFGTWNEVPPIVWADSYMEMSALHWNHLRMMRGNKK